MVPPPKILLDMIPRSNYSETMAQTPEGKVKQKVSAILKATPGVYYFMPVPSGYGESTVDYIGCYLGRFFGIETKKPGAKPTDRQKQILAAIQRAGGATFVIDGDTSELEAWLAREVQVYDPLPIELAAAVQQYTNSPWWNGHAYARFMGYPQGITQVKLQLEGYIDELRADKNFAVADRLSEIVKTVGGLRA